MRLKSFTRRTSPTRRVFLLVILSPLLAMQALAASITVQANDTLGAIAARHGISIRALMQANKLSNSSLHIGQTLVLPGPSKISIQSGDTLESLAKRYGMSVAELRRANGNSDRLKIGQELNFKNNGTADNQNTTKPESKTTTKTSSNQAVKNIAVKNGTVVVQEGDTLSEIAARTGVSVRELRQINNLGSSRLHIGQTLQLKASTENVATKPRRADIQTEEIKINSGDTLGALAVLYSTNIETLRNLNNLKNENLRVGKTFLVPKQEHKKPIVAAVKVATKPTPTFSKPTLALAPIATKPNAVQPTPTKLTPKPLAAVKPKIIIAPEILVLANQVSAKQEAAKRQLGKLVPVKPEPVKPVVVKTVAPQPAAIQPNAAKPTPAKITTQPPAAKPIAKTNPVTAAPALTSALTKSAAPTSERSASNPFGYPTPSEYTTGDGLVNIENTQTTNLNEVASNITSSADSTPINSQSPNTSTTPEQNLTVLEQTTPNTITEQPDNPPASPTYTPTEPTDPNSIIPGVGLPPTLRPTPQKPVNPNQYRGERVLWPISGQITSYFGYRSLRVARSYFHTGLDIAAPYGTTVYAAVSGTVTHAGWSRLGYGYLVVIRSVTGKEYYYGHNSRLMVRRGEFVRQGNAISRVGSTGYSTGPHCHLEIRVGGRARNPLAYLPGSMARQARYTRR